MNRVRETREQQRLAQQALAVRARISASTLVAIERYDYRPTEAIRKRIASALGCALDDLWPREDLDEDRTHI